MKARVLRHDLPEAQEHMPAQEDFLDVILDQVEALQPIVNNGFRVDGLHTRAPLPLPGVPTCPDHNNAPRPA